MKFFVVSVLLRDRTRSMSSSSKTLRLPEGVRMFTGDLSACDRLIRLRITQILTIVPISPLQQDCQTKKYYAHRSLWIAQFNFLYRDIVGVFFKWIWQNRDGKINRGSCSHLRDRLRKYSLKNFGSREIRYPLKSSETFSREKNRTSRRIWSVERTARVISSVSRIARLFEGEFNEWSRHDEVTWLPIGRPRRGVEYRAARISSSPTLVYQEDLGEIKATRCNPWKYFKSTKKSYSCMREGKRMTVKIIRISFYKKKINIKSYNLY